MLAICSMLFSEERLLRAGEMQSECEMRQSRVDYHALVRELQQLLVQLGERYAVYSYVLAFVQVLLGHRRISIDAIDHERHILHIGVRHARIVCDSPRLVEDCYVVAADPRLLVQLADGACADIFIRVNESCGHLYHLRVVRRTVLVDEHYISGAGACIFEYCGYGDGCVCC